VQKEDQPPPNMRGKERKKPRFAASERIRCPSNQKMESVRLKGRLKKKGEKSLILLNRKGGLRTILPIRKKEEKVLPLSPSQESESRKGKNFCWSYTMPKKRKAASQNIKKILKKSTIGALKKEGFEGKTACCSIPPTRKLLFRKTQGAEGSARKRRHRGEGRRMASCHRLLKGKKTAGLFLRERRKKDCARLTRRSKKPKKERRQNHQRGKRKIPNPCALNTTNGGELTSLNLSVGGRDCLKKRKHGEKREGRVYNRLVWGKRPRGLPFSRVT